MLIINGHRESCIPITHTGGVVYSDIQPNWYRSENWMRIFLGEGGFPEQTSIPGGNYHPSCWYWPMTAGAISSSGRIVGVGAVSGTGNLGYQAVANISGNGDISYADAKRFIYFLAALAGSGGVSDAGGAAYQTALNAALSGSGDISDAALQMLAFTGAALSGDGNISDADIDGIGALIAALSGSSSVTDTIGAIGELGADIKAYGDLTPEGVRDAVWQAIASDFNGAGTMGQKLNASGSAGDPWTTELPGTYEGTQAGAILKRILTMAKLAGMK